MFNNVKSEPILRHTALNCVILHLPCNHNLRTLHLHSKLLY